jgi:predicted dehydrogenase
LKLRVGLVGLGGSWQQRYAPALRALADRFEVCVICDPVQHRAQQATEEFSAVAVDGYRILAEREDLDAVLILAPQWFGALPILAACEARRAVYCAGGLELDVKEAEQIQAKVDESGIAFVAEFPKRQAPATIRLKELIATRLGEPQLLFSHRRIGTDGRSDAGFSSDGATRELIELLDWCCYIVDREPKQVTGLMHCSNGDRETEDYQMMSLDFSDGKIGTGPIAQISCGRYIPTAWQEAISYRPLAALQVSCANGVAFVDLPSTLIWFDEAGRHQESLDSERPLGEQMLTQFHIAVTTSVRKTSDLADTYRALHIVERARRSHLEGRRIEL